MVFSSKYTFWLGVFVEVLTFLERTMTEKPIPSSGPEWSRFLLQVAIGIGLILSKDWNQTNAVHANPTSQHAPEIKNTTMIEPPTDQKG